MRAFLLVVPLLGVGCLATTEDAPNEAPIPVAGDAAVESETGATDRDGAVDAVSTNPDATPSDSPSDAGPAETDPHAGKVPLFVAQGHVGRTTISCDDGKTWIANRSDDDTAVCFIDGYDCDHGSGSARGIAFGGGFFAATFGWGKPGAIRRSKDGRVWTNALEGTTFGGVAFSGGERATFLAASRTPRISTDLAATWVKASEPTTSLWNVRGAGYGAGTFVMVLEDSGTKDFALSVDDGKTWTKPTTLPQSCGNGVQSQGGVVSIESAIGSTLMVIGNDGTACRSTDAGKTWSAASMGGTVSSTALSAGKEVVAWGRATLEGKERAVMYRSTNGAQWTTTATSVLGSTATPSIGAAARSSTGTFVATNAGWQVWYEKQIFYRSTDGITWEALPKTSYVGSHPIGGIAFGWVDAAACK